MKTKLHLLLVPLILTACFDEYDGSINPSESWVYFPKSSESVIESAEDELMTEIIFAGPLRDTDLSIPFTVTTESNLVEGEDYTLPVGNLVIPAGESSAMVTLLASVIDNDLPEGNKSLTFTIESPEGVTAGFPGPDGNRKTITVNIVEDDFFVFGFTSFEEPEAGENYVDPNGANNNHDLVNFPGLNSMDYDGSGDEIGFDAIFIDTRDITSGLSDNVGVTDDYADGFTNGGQGYVLLDTDGTIQVTFDPVNVEGFDQVFLSLDWFIQSSNYEGAVDADDTGNDIFRITIITDTEDVLTIVDVDGDQLEQQYSNQFGTWATLFEDISGIKTAQLVIEVDTNTDSEGIAFDNIQFLGL